MLKSMTGFGRATATCEGMLWTIEIASVNSRFLDVSARFPRSLAAAEFAIRKRVGERISRGKISVTVSWEVLPGEGSAAQVNDALAQAYIKQLNDLKVRHKLSGEVGIELVAGLPELFSNPLDSGDKGGREEELLKAVDEALSHLDQMRIAEGRSLGQDMLARVRAIQEQLAAMESEAAEYARNLEARVKERVAKLFSEVAIDPQRVAQEAAMLAERADITEETVRLGVHLSEFAKVLDQGGQVGRRLNFLLQEMVRETNTIGSKTGELTVIQRVVLVKEELEKIREQAQNLE
jgi:uncharacterized protein (TIGR00255 family)